MTGTRVALTAGLDAAPHVLALAELLERAGYEIAGIVVVTPFSLPRIRSRIRQHGLRGLVDAASRVAPAIMSPGAPSPALLSTYNVAQRSLRTWAHLHHTIYMTTRDLNSADCISRLGAMNAAGVVYGGGGILRSSFLHAARGRVLNAHAGPLPGVRGMNACEWSLLLRVPPTVSIHAIDEGIDTGPVFERIPIPIGVGDSIETVREKSIALGVEGLVRNAWRLDGEGWPPMRMTSPGTRQCFVLSPILRELAIVRLQSVTTA